MSKKEEIVEKIEGMLSDESRTKAGRVLWVYDKIVELQERGVTIAKIEEILNAVCFVDDKLKSGSLKTYLYRIRKEKKKGKTNDVVPVAAGTAVAPATKITPPESSRKRTGNGLPDLELLEKEARELVMRPEPRRTNY